MTRSPETIAHRIRQDAVALAGRPNDLVQRASVYVELFRHSGGRHCFPLIAAHGALWGAGHFRRGLALARTVSIADPARHQKMARLERFAQDFKEINRRVCVETYAAYHITRKLGSKEAQRVGVPKKLASALTDCHDARRQGRVFGTTQKAALFQAFFRWEQDNVVQKAVDDAVARLDWPLMRTVSMRPPVRFRYSLRPMLFRNFASKSERIEKGQLAFDLAEKRGWHRVEADLARYRTMPQAFFDTPRSYYDELVSGLNLTSVQEIAPI